MRGSHQDACHNPVTQHFYTVPLPPHTLATPQSTITSLTATSRTFQARHSTSSLHEPGTPSTIILIRNSQGQTLIEIEFIISPRICDLATSIQFRIGTNHLIAIQLDHLQTPTQLHQGPTFTHWIPAGSLSLSVSNLPHRCAHTVTQTFLQNTVHHHL